MSLIKTKILLKPANPTLQTTTKYFKASLKVADLI